MQSLQKILTFLKLKSHDLHSGILANTVIASLVHCRIEICGTADIFAVLHALCSIKVLNLHHLRTLKKLLYFVWLSRIF